MLAMHCQNGMHNAHVGHREWKLSMVYPKKKRNKLQGNSKSTKLHFIWNVSHFFRECPKIGESNCDN